MVCLRNGVEKSVHCHNIVVGDVIKIKAGMNIPVDGIILQGSGIQCNEAVMTGKSDELKKDTLENCFLWKKRKTQMIFLTKITKII